MRTFNSWGPCVPLIHGLRIHDAHTNLPARGLASTNLPARSPTLRTCPHAASYLSACNISQLWARNIRTYLVCILTGE